MRGISAGVKGSTHWPSYARRLKKEAESSLKSGKYPEKEVEKAEHIPDAYSRTLAVSTLFRDVCQSGMESDALWKSAISSAAEIDQEWKREELLEKLVSWGFKCGRDVKKLPDMMDDRELRMKLLSKLIRLSDEKDMLDIWNLWAERPEKDRYEVLRMMVHNGYPKEHAVELAAELSEERVKMIATYSEGRERKRERTDKAPKIPDIRGPRPSLTLALYNSYRGKASEVHFRSISRAASLCYAFDLNLALVGFPFDNAEQCIERTISSTRIGDGSEYLRALRDAKRFEIYREISSIEGKMVATTPYPAPEKAMKTDEIEEGMVFLMGLGHDGLPEKVLENARHHLEFTGKRASLETCTAMGVLAYMLHIRRKPYIVG